MTRADENPDGIDSLKFIIDLHVFIFEFFTNNMGHFIVMWMIECQ